MNRAIYTLMNEEIIAALKLLGFKVACHDNNVFELTGNGFPTRYISFVDLDQGFSYLATDACLDVQVQDNSYTVYFDKEINTKEPLSIRLNREGIGLDTDTIGNNVVISVERTNKNGQEQRLKLGSSAINFVVGQDLLVNGHMTDRHQININLKPLVNTSEKEIGEFETNSVFRGGTVDSTYVEKTLDLSYYKLRRYTTDDEEYANALCCAVIRDSSFNELHSMNIDIKDYLPFKLVIMNDVDNINMVESVISTLNSLFCRRLATFLKTTGVCCLDVERISSNARPENLDSTIEISDAVLLEAENCMHFLTNGLTPVEVKARRLCGKK